MGWPLAVVMAMAFAAEPDWRAKAWAVWQSKDAEFLVRELQDARELSRSETNSEQFAYVQTLLDALIQSGAKPPTEAVLPFVDRWAPESLILIARSGGDEEMLLPLAKRFAAAPEWLVVANLLLRERSGRFLAAIIEETQPEQVITVHDGIHGCGSRGKGVAVRLSATVREQPATFPPAGVYELLGSRPLSFRRSVVEPGAAQRLPERFVAGHWAEGIDFLAEASGMSRLEVRAMFLAETGAEWRSAGDLQRVGDKAVKEQEAGIRRLVAAAKAAGYPIPPLHLRIPVRVIDYRQKSREPLPTFEDQRLDID